MLSESCTFTPVIVASFLENFQDLEYDEIFGESLLQTDAEGILTYRIPLWGGRDEVP